MTESEEPADKGDDGGDRPETDAAGGGRPVRVPDRVRVASRRPPWPVPEVPSGAGGPSVPRAVRVARRL